MAEDLRTPTVHVVDSRLDEHRRRVPTEPVIRLSLFTTRGTERGVNLTPDEAVNLAHALLTAHQGHRRVTRQVLACRECGGQEGRHHMVHTRYGNGGGGNRMCSRYVAPEEDPRA